MGILDPPAPRQTSSPRILIAALVSPLAAVFVLALFSLMPFRPSLRIGAAGAVIVVAYTLHFLFALPLVFLLTSHRSPTLAWLLGIGLVVGSVFVPFLLLDGIQKGEAMFILFGPACGVAIALTFWAVGVREWE